MFKSGVGNKVIIALIGNFEESGESGPRVGDKVRISVVSMFGESLLIQLPQKIQCRQRHQWARRQREAVRELHP